LFSIGGLHVRLPAVLRPAHWIVCLGAFWLSCSRDLAIPEAPRIPQLSGFTPASAFSGDRLVVFADNVDGLGNQLLFPGGISVLAESVDGGDVRVDGGLAFVVPEGLQVSGPLILSATGGRSEPSVEPFTPLGTGHPNLGTPVAQLRFRHDPIGLVDRTENVLMASSIFDLIVTDGKAFRRVPGTPLALARSAIVGRGLLSVATPSGGGMLLEVDTADGAILTRSAESDTREHFILPAFDVATLARTVGLDTRGQAWLSTWSNQNGTLVSSRQALPFTALLGAAALDGLVVVVGQAALEATPAVFVVTPSQVARAWTPGNPGCMGPECELPDGPVAVVRVAGGLRSVVVSVASGDLVVLEGAPFTPRPIKLISYAPIDALAAGIDPEKVVFTKASDGALFQLDLTSEEVDWAVQLRGEPTVIDVAADIDEIAVGNRLENAVDIVTASTGGWTGRIAFNLGLGSAGGTPGGIVAPYSFDPALMPQASLQQRLDVLMRHVGLVVGIDASSLEVIDHVVLEAAGPPLRLVVTPDFKTLVVHQHRLGLLEGPVGERVERVVTAQDIETPQELVVLSSGAVISGTPDRVRWYRWVNGSLEPGGTLSLPVGAMLQALAADGDEVLVVWRSISTGAFGGGFYRPDEFQGGTATRVLDLPPGLSEFLGVVNLREGPAVLFGRDALGAPVALTRAMLREGGPGVFSSITHARPALASPDGRFVVWLDESSAERLARLVRADDELGWWGYSTYRLAGSVAGPAFDPSGQWFYLPVPLLDQLDVVQ
jgi:hypothetical protein